MDDGSKIPVIWKSYNPDSPAKGYWDQGMIQDLFNGTMWAPANGFKFIDVYDFGGAATFNGGGIVVIPARSNTEYIDELNKDIHDMSWVIIMLTGDEENVFPIDKINHPNAKIYVMSPRQSLNKSRYRVLGTGYPPQIHDFLADTEAPNKDVNWFFAGQVTHGRRVECVEQLRDMKLEGSLLESQGFTQGLEPQSYYAGLAKSKVAPCPSGPETPDTFRLFEALEAGCVPIADTLVSKGGFTSDYWRFFFDEWPPFPIIQDYTDLPGYIEDQVNQYPAKNNRVFAWWQSKKRDMAYQLQDDIKELSAHSASIRNKETVTVIIPVSPIKSHPSTEILDETIASVRHHLPDSEIIVTFDGVRKESEDRRDDYEEFMRRMLWKFNHNSQYNNVLPVIFDRHMHQTGMAKAVMDKIKTPLVMYVEQDTPLVTDEEINWMDCIVFLLTGRGDVIRFHHESVIPLAHKHMMLENHNEDYLDSFMLATCQWSQRPHLATTAFYRRILDTCFSEDAKSFIEDKMHGICHEAYIKDGVFGWEQYKLFIYAPNSTNIKRSYHTDGRAGEAKYDDSQIF